MIDRDHLENVARRHSLEMEIGTTFELHLMTGEIYSIREMLEFGDDYCVAAVYPQDPLSEKTLKEQVPHNDKGRPVFDRIIVPYQLVSYVRLTAREAERRGSVGFNE